MDGNTADDRIDDQTEDERAAAKSQADAADAQQDAVRAERDQLADQLKHALADMANMRRRAIKEAEDSRRRIVEGITQELLPVLDNFELALRAYDEQGEQASASSLFEGVRMVQLLLTSALERHGLQPIHADGQPFDPARHEALAVEPTEDAAQGTVLRVLQPGYLLGDRVLRHAKVVVAGEPATSTDDSTGKSS